MSKGIFKFVQINMKHLLYMESGMQQHTSTYSVLIHTLYPWAVVKGAKNPSESSHVAYQIKGNGASSTMQAHILSLHTPSTFGLY